MARKSVNKIQLSPETTQYFAIFGIVSSEPAYKLSVLINQTIGKSLQSTEPVPFASGEKTAGFSRFADKSDLPLSSLTLIQNRAEKQILMKKFPNIDYILVSSIEGGKKEEVDIYASLVRSVKHVTAVFIIDKEQVEKLILEAITTSY